jgi:hypothetical protein
MLETNKRLREIILFLDATFFNQASSIQCFRSKKSNKIISVPEKIKQGMK